MKNLISRLIVSIFIFPATAFTADWDDINWDLVKQIEAGCVSEAQRLADKAASDAVNISEAFGGNISSEMIKSLEESKVGYIPAVITVPI